MTCCAPKSDEEKEKFFPKYTNKVLTLKFYARHDQFAVNPERFEYHCKELEKRQDVDVRTKFPFPITENQVYGWLDKKAFHYNDEMDQEILCKPKKADEVMRTLQKIATHLHNHRMTTVAIKK